MINIYTFAYNRPDFIELQLRSLHRHLQGEFLLTIFNTAAFGGDSAWSCLIRAECQRLNLEVIDVLQDGELLNSPLLRWTEGGHVPCSVLINGRFSYVNVAHAYAMNWAWRHIITKRLNPICILECDAFLVDSLDLEDILRRYQLVFVPQGRSNALGSVEYIWPGFVLANLPALPTPCDLDWWCGCGKHGLALDVGGQTWKYLEAHPELAILRIASGGVMDDWQCEMISIEEKAPILHYRCASDWERRGEEFHARKTRWLRERLEQ